MSPTPFNQDEPWKQSFAPKNAECVGGEMGPGLHARILLKCI